MNKCKIRIEATISKVVEVEGDDLILAARDAFCILLKDTVENQKPLGAALLDVKLFNVSEDENGK